MRTVDDLGRSPAAKQCTPLTAEAMEPKGEESAAANPHAGNPQRQGAASGCPFHALLAGLNIFGDRESDF